MKTQVIRLALFGMLWVCAASRVVQAGTHHYYYTDPQQGTVLAKADASGTIIATYDYAPYGTAVVSMSPAPNGPGYTGHVNDPDTGLVYMQARYYDPAVGRFLSVDPVESAAGNRYMYGGNNPITSIDPTGMYPKNMSASEISCEIYRCETTQRGGNDYSISSPPSNVTASTGKSRNEPTSAVMGQNNADSALQEFIVLLRDGKLPQVYDFAKKIAFSVVYNDKDGQKRSELGGAVEGGHSRYTSVDSYRIDLFKGGASSVRLAFKVIAHEILHGQPDFWNFYINVVNYQTDKEIRRNQLDMLHGQMQPYINQAIKVFDDNYIPTLPTVEVTK